MHLFRGSPALGGSGDEDSALALTTRGRREHRRRRALLGRRMGWRGSGPDGHPQGLQSRRSRRRPRDSRIHELEAILDTATDGVIVLDETGRILSLNRSAEALFGYDEREVAGDAITVLLAPESHIVALDYLEGLRSPGVGKPAQRRPRGSRPGAPGRLDPALHDHGPPGRWAGSPVLRRAARHHRLQEGRGRADRRQARGRGGERPEIRSSGQDQPRDPHAAERHHRLCRGDARGALRARSATSATRNISRTFTPPARM